MNNLLQSCISKLKVAKGPTNSGEYICWCCFHPDGKGEPPHRPNLHVSENGFICFACGEKGSVRKLADELGIEKSTEEIQKVYNYTNENNDLLFQVIRRNGKRFIQRRPDGNGGWIWNLKGVPRVLYRLPEIISGNGEIVYIAEGEKDADRLFQEGLLATTSPGGAGKWKEEYNIYLESRDVVIFPDNDEEGRNHAEQVAQSLTGVANTIKIVELPGLPRKGDISDFLTNGNSVNELHSIIEKTGYWQKTGNRRSKTCKNGKVERKIKGYYIKTNDRQLSDIIKEAQKAIIGNNKKILEALPPAIQQDGAPLIFQRSNCPVRLVHEHNMIQIQTLNENHIFGALTRIVRWVTITEDDEGNEKMYNAKQPKDVAKDIIALPPKELPELDTIITSPIFNKEAELIIKPGYHENERLWYHPDATVDIPSINENPTDEEIDSARNLIVNDLLIDFPFVSDSDRAHAVAAILLPFVRHMIKSPTPLHMVEAPTPGSGKGLLCNLISIVTTGNACPARTIPENDEELRKMITSELSRAPQVILLDNLSQRKMLNSAALSTVLTTEIWTDRLLSYNRMTSLQNNALWMMTGNNPRISNELARRSIRIRIDPRQDRPWSRTEFKHNPIQFWAMENRSRLIHAALTLIQAWIAEEKPKGKINLGSFESWASVIGGILNVAGVPGFLENLEELYAEADEEGDMWREFIMAWWSEYGGREVRPSELNELCKTHHLMELVRGDKEEQSQVIRLGKALKNAHDRVFGNLRICLIRDKGAKHGKYYALRQEGNAQDEAHSFGGCFVAEGEDEAQYPLEHPLDETYDYDEDLLH